MTQTQLDKYDRAVAQWLIERHGTLEGFAPEDAVHVRFEHEIEYSSCPTCGNDYSFGIEYRFRKGSKVVSGLYGMESYPTGQFVAEVAALIA